MALREAFTRLNVSALRGWQFMIGKIYQMAQRLNYVVLSVYGPYSWGKKKGHVNPKSRVDIRLYTEGRTVKETISDFQKDIGKETIYKIEKVVQEDRPMAKVA